MKRILIRSTVYGHITTCTRAARLEGSAAHGEPVVAGVAAPAAVPILARRLAVAGARPVAVESAGTRCVTLETTGAGSLTLEATGAGSLSGAGPLRSAVEATGAGSLALSAAAETVAPGARRALLAGGRALEARVVVERRRVGRAALAKGVEAGRALVHVTARLVAAAAVAVAAAVAAAATVTAEAAAAAVAATVAAEAAAVAAAEAAALAATVAAKAVATAAAAATAPRRRGVGLRDHLDALASELIDVGVGSAREAVALATLEPVAEAPVVPTHSAAQA